MVGVVLQSTCRAKKRKVPLLHGEEIDIDISNLE
jgi:hypothetical protein